MVTLSVNSKKTVGNTGFPEQRQRFVNLYEKAGYKLNIIMHTQCMGVTKWLITLLPSLLAHGEAGL